MPAPKGNQFWKARAKHGRDKIFKTPDLMWEAACEYFDWVTENPLKEAVVYQGSVSKDSKPLMRAMTIDGLCIFWDVSPDYLTVFEHRLEKDNDQDQDFLRIIRKIKSVIRTQKIEGAAAGLLKENIIARETGLADKSEHSGPDGRPIEVDQQWSVEFVNPSDLLDAES